tara:strand:+ start:1 stop:1233 length:1233 start_codon:yes stop_codon:yes gene_type:complete
MTLKSGVECEYFLINPEGTAISDLRDTQPKPCYDQSALMRQYDLIKEICDSMIKLGWQPYQNDHEDANGQFEMNWNFTDSLSTADRHVFFKFMVKAIAEKHGLRATFMPKPFENLTGNGCHAHISLWTGNKNLFLDKGDKLGLTKLAYNFLGGILNSAEGLSAFFNPSINSYRRIDAPAPTSGASWSPSKISYTGNNRTHMIRIPDPGRFELRLMDGSANPYLLQAGVIAAGIDGIEKKRDPGHPLFINMYKDADNYPNLKKLPSDLENALEFLSNSEILVSAFGEKNITSYLKLKQQELKDFNLKETFSKKEPITDWEKLNTLDCWYKKFFILKGIVLFPLKFVLIFKKLPEKGYFFISSLRIPFRAVETNSSLLSYPPKAQLVIFFAASKILCILFPLLSYTVIFPPL